MLCIHRVRARTHSIAHRHAEAGWRVRPITPRIGAGQPIHTHGGSWQGFKAYIARHLGPDLTIIVFANLAEADAERFVDGIAAIIDPLLVRPAPSP